jgi:hypothetical protein
VEISPVPSDEEAVAIAAAIEVAWPRAVAVPPAAEPPPPWRFAGRWWTKPIPVRRDRPW